MSWLRASLPQEHGSWSFVLEPLLVGALIQRTTTGWIAAAGAFLLFLAFRPLQLGLKDLLRKKRYPRTIPCTVLGLALGAIGTGGVLTHASGIWILGLGLIYVVVAERLRHDLAREMVGATIMLPFSCMALPAMAPLFLLRPLVTIMGVRGYFNRTADATLCARIGIAGGLGLLALAAAKLWPLHAVALAFAYGLAGCRGIQLGILKKRDLTPKRIGMEEGMIAVVVVLSWALWRAG